MLYIVWYFSSSKVYLSDLYLPESAISSYSYPQGDIELLQFANKPDVAYDLCLNIAPDCEGFGSQYEGAASTGNVNRLGNTNGAYSYTPTPDLDLMPPPTDRTIYEPVDENPSLNVRNGSNELWSIATRDLSTSKPFWPAPDAYAQLSQYSTSTDAGEL